MKTFKNFLFALFLLPFLISPALAQDVELDVPYVPTPEPVVDRMLEMGNVGPGEYVIDLGSGDGRIVIEAANRGATGLGVDLDPERIGEARNNAREEEVDDLVMFKQQDIFETDISSASVVTLYLLPSVNTQLRPVLMKNLEPGTPVVSHRFDMGEWKADSVSTLSLEDRTHTVYLWYIPARVDGKWEWETMDQDFRMRIEQSHQEIEPTLNMNGKEMTIHKAILKGRQITIIAEEGNKRFLFSGRAEGDTIKGSVQIRSNIDNQVMEWKAEQDSIF